MPEPEFVRYQAFADRRLLPARRVELMLARVCLLLDAGLCGAKEATLSDYLFDPPDEDDAAALFGFAPRS
jgi:hypothetical protein